MPDGKADQIMSTYFATCPKGIESLLRREIESIGAADCVETVAGVSFTGSIETAMRVCLWSRLASRIRLTLAEGEVETPDDLYQLTRQLDWSEHMNPDSTFAVQATVSANRSFTDSRFAALKVKDAIADQFREKTGQRPSIERKHPDIQCFTHIRKTHAVIGLDLCARSLHHRGYRAAASEAPLRENLAAAMLLLADWPSMAAQGASLVDPMCGSGTLLVEAVLMAADIAPGLIWARRDRFGWKGWQDDIWSRLIDEALDRKSVGLQQLDNTFIGVDIDEKTLDIARKSTDFAGLHRYIEYHHGGSGEAGGFSSGKTGLVITNPPYGERLSEQSVLHDLYLNLGKTMQAGFAAWRFSIIAADPHLCRVFPFGLIDQHTLYNGPLQCRLMNFEVPETPRDVSEATGMLVNRLQKNRKKLRKYLNSNAIEAYRLYDADMPEFAAAIDLYGDHIHIQEYQAPASIPEAVTRQRLADIVRAVDVVFEPGPGAIVVKQRSRQRGKSQYQKHDSEERGFWIREYGLRFRIQLQSYLDTGLFLDHRETRRWIRSISNDRKFLNLFCYTASVTVHAAAGGATASVSVDLSNTYLDWARTNMAANDVSTRRHRLERADCMQWIRDTDEVFDLIFIDPPTFSNSKRMDHVFDVQRDHVKLLGYAIARLAEGGEIVFSTNFRKFKLELEKLKGVEVEEITHRTVPPDFRQKPPHRCWHIRKRDGNDG